MSKRKFKAGDIVRVKDTPSVRTYLADMPHVRRSLARAKRVGQVVAFWLGAYTVTGRCPPRNLLRLIHALSEAYLAEREK